MPKQVYQASDGSVFDSFEDANSYEVTQEMEMFERLGLDQFLQSVADENGEDGETYHANRQFLSDLLRWCAENDKVLTIRGKNDPVYRQSLTDSVNENSGTPIAPVEPGTTGAERGFPDTSIPPGIKADEPIPYEPAPAEGICARR